MFMKRASLNVDNVCNVAYFTSFGFCKKIIEGGGESMRDQGKRRRHGLGGCKDRFKLVLLFEIIKLIFC